jgi:hypothetical protein
MVAVKSLSMGGFVRHLAPDETLPKAKDISSATSSDYQN